MSTDINGKVIETDQEVYKTYQYEIFSYDLLRMLCKLTGLSKPFYQVQIRRFLA
jgi:hypothetical protein